MTLKVLLFKATKQTPCKAKRVKITDVYIIMAVSRQILGSYFIYYFWN